MPCIHVAAISILSLHSIHYFLCNPNRVDTHNHPNPNVTVAPLKSTTWIRLTSRFVCSSYDVINTCILSCKQIFYSFNMYKNIHSLIHRIITTIIAACYHNPIRITYFHNWLFIQHYIVCLKIPTLEINWPSKKREWRTSQ